MESGVTDDIVSAYVKDDNGYTYVVEASIVENRASGTFSDPQTGAVLGTILILESEVIRLQIFESLEVGEGSNPVLTLVFARPGAAPPAVTDEIQLDPSMIGLWTYSESTTDPGSSFSFLVEWFLELRSDGSFVQASRSAGGTGGVSANNEPQVVAQGKWKTDQKVLWVDTGNGFQPFVRYLVDAQNMMFSFQDGSRQLWNRLR